MKPTYCAVLVAATVFIPSFGYSGETGELTRDKAKAVIEGTKGFDSGQFAWPRQSEHEADCGVTAGLWTKQANPIFGGTMLTLTAKGNTIFTELGNYTLGLKSGKPIAREIVAVTGISDPPPFVGAHGSVADVGFTWRWKSDQLPEEVRRCFENKPSCAGGILKRYDDGWRLESTEARQCGA